MPEKCPRCGRPVPDDAPGGVCPFCVLEDALAIPEGDRPRAAGVQQDLAFCLLAVQMTYATPDQFMKAGIDWLSSPESNLAEQLTEQAAIDPEKVTLINGLAEAAVRHHGGDVGKTLEEASAHPSIEAYLASLSDFESKGDETRLGLPLALNADHGSTPAMSEDPGRYTRKSEYSRGGMGRILLVHDQYLARDIALKELLPSQMESSGAISEKAGATPLRQTSAMIARFLREAKITGQLEHPNVVPVYELGRREAGNFYYTMKLIRGRSFAVALKEARSFEDRIRYLPQLVDLCQAIAYAHSRSVIHRDIKPANVMLGPFGETVVIDWGLAKILGHADESDAELSSVIEKMRDQESVEDFETRDGARLGTPAYMPPEQARGEVDRVDERSDVFSIGAILHEILTGKTPFTDSPVGTLLHKLGSDPVPSPALLNPDAPGELVAICEKALAFNAADRYQNAGELLADLERFLSGAVVSVYRYSLVEFAKRFYTRNRDAVRIGIAAAIALIIFGIYSFVRIQEERDNAIIARDDARVSTYSMGIQLTQRQLAAGSHNLARDTLDELPEEERQWEWFYNSNRASPAQLTVEDVSVLRWAPDGETIVTAGIGQPIRILDATTGQVESEIETALQRPGDVAVSSDGSRIALAGTERVVYVYDAGNGELIQTFDGHRGAVRDVEFVEGGARVLSHDSERTTALWTVETGDTIWSADLSEYEIYDLTVSSDERYFINRPFGNGNIQAEETLQAIVWEMDTGEIVLETAGRALDVDAATNRLYVGNEGMIEIRDISNGTVLAQMEMPSESEAILGRLDSTGAWLASADRSGDWLIWEIESETIMLSNASHSPIRDLYFDWNNDVLLTLHIGLPNLRVWSPRTGVQRFAIEDASSYAFSADPTPNWSRFAATAGDRIARIWDLGRGPVYETLTKVDLGSGTWLVGEERGTAYLAAKGGGTCALEADTGRILYQVQGSTFFSTSSAAPLLSDESIIFLLDGVTLGIFDTNSREIGSSRLVHDASIKATALTPDGQTLISASWDGEIRSSSAADLQTIQSHSLDETYATVMDVRSDGQSIMIGCDDGRLYSYAPSSGSPPVLLGSMSSTITALEFSSDPNQLYVGTYDGVITLWDISSRGAVVQRNGHDGVVNSFEFIPQANRLISTERFEMPMFWRADDLTPLGSLEGFHSRWVESVDFDASSGTLTGVTKEGAYTKWWGETHESSAQRVIPEFDDSPLPVIGVVGRPYLNLVANAIAERSDVTPELDDSNPLMLFGLQIGDRVVAVNGQPVDTPEELSDAAETILGGADVDSFQMSIVRNYRTYEIDFTVIDQSEDTVDVPVSRVEAVDALETIRDRIIAFDTDTQGFNHQFATFVRGAEGDYEVPLGLIVSLIHPEDRVRFFLLKLAELDRLVEFDGSTIGDPEEFRNRLEEAAAAIADGTQNTFEFVVDRGAFRQVTIRYQIQ